jgi:hypothetical protein
MESPLASIIYFLQQCEEECVAEEGKEESCPIPDTTYLLRSMFYIVNFSKFRISLATPLPPCPGVYFVKIPLTFKSVTVCSDLAKAATSHLVNLTFVEGSLPAGECQVHFWKDNKVFD